MSGKKQTGFTIVELLVVIAIIAAITAILLPGMGKARGLAYRLRCASNLRQIDLALRAYMDRNNDTYPCSSDPCYILWPGRKWRPFIAPYLGGSIDGNNPYVLWCQQDRYSKLNYDSTSYAYSMSFYHSSEQIDNLVYTPTQSEQFFNTPPVGQHSTSVAKPSGKIVVGEWLSNHSSINANDGACGWWCQTGKRNYLFADGQVRLIDAGDIRTAHDGFPNPNVTINGIRGIDWPR